MSVRAQKNPAINSAASIEFLFGLTGVVSFRRALPTANYCTRELRWELDCFARWAQRMFKAARPPSDDCRRGRRATGPSSHAPAPPSMSRAGFTHRESSDGGGAGRHRAVHLFIFRRKLGSKG